MRKNAQKFKEFCDYTLKTASEEAIAYMLDVIGLAAEGMAKLKMKERKNPEKAFRISFTYSIREEKINENLN